MRKILFKGLLIALLCFCLFSTDAQAIVDDVKTQEQNPPQTDDTIREAESETENMIIPAEIEQEQTSEHLEDLTAEKNTFQEKYGKYYSFDKGILRLKLNEKFQFDMGMIGTMNWDMYEDDDYRLHSQFKFTSADLILSGKLNKYFSYKAQVLPHRNIDEQTILGDVFVKAEYKNNELYMGRRRKPIGYEPALSPYDYQFVSASQISRRFGDNRDTGLLYVGKTKYADLALGLFANMQNRPFDFSRSGPEFSSYLTLKPLANYPQLGNLKLAGGIATGQLDYSYNIFSGFASYDYKRFGAKFEYINRGAKAEGETDVRGYYADLTYYLTKKLQLALRYDHIMPENEQHSTEYVAGVNYYLNNRNIMVALNYVFRDAETMSHRVALQFRYKTW